LATLAHFTAHVARRAALRTATHGGERFGDVRVDRFLIHRAALAFATPSTVRRSRARTGTAGTGLSLVAPRGRSGTTAAWRRRRDGTRRSEPAAARHR